MTKKKITKSFEQNLKRLQEISELLDNSDIGLEEAINLYEEGIVLSQDCLNVLKNAELKVTELKSKMDKIINNEIDE